MSDRIRKFGQYLIHKSLGQGGMGEVVLATDTTLDRKVAIKFLKAREGDKNKILEQRFQNEAKILASLNNPNIVSIFNYGKEGDINYIVMEYVEGQPLSAAIKSNSLSPVESLKILKDMVSGITAAHEKGILHRDIKPANIIIDELSRVKIVDFGISKNLVDNSSKYTKTDHFVGTISYMAPELLRGQNPTPSSDIYSMGVVFFEMLIGFNPFYDENQFKSIEKIKKTHLRLPKELLDLLSPELFFIFDKMVDPKKENRYQSTAELLYDLKQFDLSNLPNEIIYERETSRPIKYLSYAQVLKKLGERGFMKTDIVHIFNMAYEMDLEEKETTAGGQDEDKTIPLGELSERKINEISLRQALHLFKEKQNASLAKTSEEEEEVVSFSSITLKQKIAGDGKTTVVQNAGKSIHVPQKRRTKSLFSRLNLKFSSVGAIVVLCAGLVIIGGFLGDKLIRESTGDELRSLMSAVDKIAPKSKNKGGAFQPLEDGVDGGKQMLKRALGSVVGSGPAELQFPKAGTRFKFKITEYNEKSGKILLNEKRTIHFTKSMGGYANATFSTDKSRRRGMMKIKANNFIPPVLLRDTSGKTKRLRIGGNYDEIYPLKVGNQMNYSYTTFKEKGDFHQVQEACQVKAKSSEEVFGKELEVFVVECLNKSPISGSQTTYHYSPELRYFVKKKVRAKTPQGYKVTIMDLVTFSVPKN